MKGEERTGEGGRSLLAWWWGDGGREGEKEERDQEWAKFVS